MSIDLSTDCVNKRSYVGIILYWIEGTNNGKCREKYLLIAFNFFPESHTTDNIQTYIVKVVGNFQSSYNFASHY